MFANAFPKHGRHLLPILLWLAVAGCGRKSDDRVEVRGQVTFDGATVDEGTISLIPLDAQKQSSAGGRIQAGQYHIAAERGPRPGSYRVEIQGVRKTGRQVPSGMGGKGALVDEVEQYLPERFNRKSEITADIPDQPTAKIEFHLAP